MSNNNWPLVTENEALRARTEQCMQCAEPIGKPHSPDCALVTKLCQLKVEVLLDGKLVTADLADELPHAWDEGRINKHYKSMWCSLNLFSCRDPDSLIWHTDDPKETWDRFEETTDGGCGCDIVKISYVKDLDQTPSIVVLSDARYDRAVAWAEKQMKDKG